MSDEGIRITYVVNHGICAPRVGLKTKVLGGDLEVVAMGDLSARLDWAESLLRQAQAAIEHELPLLDEEIRDFLQEN